MSVQTQWSGPPTDINAALADTLAMNVVGIGPTLAQRIVAHRDVHGPFSSVGDLVQVMGISSKLLAKIRDQVTVGNMVLEPQSIGNYAGIAFAEGGPMADENRIEEEQGGDEPFEGTERQRPDAIVPWPERLPAGDQDTSAELTSETEFEEPESEPAFEAEPEFESELGPEPEFESEFEEPELETGFEPGPGPEFEELEPETRLDAEVEPVAEFEELEPEEEQEPESAFVAYVQGPEIVETSDEEIAASEMESTVEGVGEGEVEPMAAETTTARGAETVYVERDATRVEREPVTQVVERGPGIWQSVLLVLLGGIAGVLLTLLVLVIGTGTVNFASRAEMDALSRNLNTVHGNQEVAWQRVDQLITRANELEAEVIQLRALRDQFGAMETGLAAAQADVAAAQTGLTTLQQGIQQLETDLQGSMGELDQRVQVAEGDIADMGTTVQAVETQVERVGVFFGALRDLLNDMPGLSEPAPATAP
jgi:competence ComEA-like helix-hairpin-helix protein